MAPQTLPDYVPLADALVPNTDAEAKAPDATKDATLVPNTSEVRDEVRNALEFARIARIMRALENAKRTTTKPQTVRMSVRDFAVVYVGTALFYMLMTAAALFATVFLLRFLDWCETSNRGTLACATDASACHAMDKTAQMACIDRTVMAKLYPACDQLILGRAAMERRTRACDNFFAAHGGYGSDAMLAYVAKTSGSAAVLDAVKASACVYSNETASSSIVDRVYAGMATADRYCVDAATETARWTSAPNRTCTPDAVRAAIGRALGDRWRTWLDDARVCATLI